MHAGKPQKQSLAIAYSKQKEAQHHRKMWLGGEVDDEPGQDEHDNLVRAPKLNEGVVKVPNDTILDISAEDFDEGPSISPANATQKFAEGGEVGRREDEDGEPDEDDETAEPFKMKLAKGGLVHALRRQRRGY